MSARENKSAAAAKRFLFFQTRDQYAIRFFCTVSYIPLDFDWRSGIIALDGFDALLPIGRRA